MKLRHLFMLINAFVMFIPLMYTLMVGVFNFFIGKWLKKDDIRQYGKTQLISVDQMANSVLLGHEDETISSRTGRAIMTHKPKWWVKIWRRVLDWGAERLGDGPNHSVRSIERRFHDQAELWYWYKK